MESISKITYSVVALVVIVLIVATTVIPVIADVQEQQYTGKNNTAISYSILDANDTGSYVYEVKNGKLFLNGEELKDVALPATGRLFGIFVTDSSQGQLMNTGQINVTVIDATKTAGSTELPPIIPDEDKLIFNNGTISVYDGSAGTTANYGTYTKAMIPNGKGPYALASTSNVKYISNESEYFIRITAATINADYTFATGFVKATPKDGITGSIINYVADGEQHSLTNLTGTVSGLSVNDAVSYSYTTLTTTINEITATQDYVFIPIKYNYISDDDSMIRALLGVIPLMLLVVPVMLAANMITTRRD